MTDKWHELYLKMQSCVTAAYVMGHQARYLAFLDVLEIMESMEAGE